MAYIYPAPGVSGVQATLSLDVASNGSDSGLTIPALQDVTVNNANDVFTWTQLDSTAKQQIATTSTNSISMNLVLEQTTFFGDATASANTAALSGIFGLSKDKTKVGFKTISGSGYITGLAPTVSADAPVWVTPITVTVDGEYTVS